jgi:hypothetical protein
MKRTKITHVAIRFENTTFVLPAPYRHHDVISLIYIRTGQPCVDVDEDDQGFLDESGRYLNRRQALISALENHQVKDESEIRLRMLFSEDVW